MPRSVEEWIGTTPDTPVPPRVKVRVFERTYGICAGCTRLIFAGDKWECDHKIPLIAGGENRESNLQVLCDWCHRDKTKLDVANKATTYRKRAKHLGVPLKKKRALPGGKDSPWKIKINGTVVRRYHEKEDESGER